MEEGVGSKQRNRNMLGQLVDIEGSCNRGCAATLDV